MDRIGRGGVSLERVVELYKEEGLEINAEQAAQVLDYLRKLAKIVVAQYTIDPGNSFARTEGDQ